MSQTFPETETVTKELAAIRKALEGIADGHGKHYNGKFPRDNAWAALDRVERLEAALTSRHAQRPADEARAIVTEWLGMFDPPPQIDFQQSELLQQAIASALHGFAQCSQQWQPIETAPKMKNILLFAVTDLGENGEVRNWKMDTGYWSSGAECWTWSGYQVRKYDIHPTHWMHMPDAPALSDTSTDRLTAASIDPETPTCSICGARVFDPCRTLERAKYCLLPPGTSYSSPDRKDK